MTHTRTSHTYARTYMCANPPTPTRHKRTRRASARRLLGHGATFNVTPAHTHAICMSRLGTMVLTHSKANCTRRKAHASRHVYIYTDTSPIANTRMKRLWSGALAANRGTGAPATTVGAACRARRLAGHVPTYNVHAICVSRPGTLPCISALKSQLHAPRATRITSHEHRLRMHIRMCKWGQQRGCSKAGTTSKQRAGD